ncbi:uncharacterized protein LOC103314088 [Tribolium castaneum]|uniref:uncharacterized protein LOC103314088 n=1 Tax=Tribolium castaneum TaxID=7070 RepID=UPI0030FEA8BC
MDSPTPQKINVRNIISIFENQSVHNVNNESNFLIRKTKSVGNLSHTARVKATPVRSEPEKNLELVQIEQQIEHLRNKLGHNYHTYVRETHVYYQNQIVFLLGDLCNIETGNSKKLGDLKSELGESLKQINKKLNALLPSTSNTTSASHTNGVIKSKSVEERPEKMRVQRSKSEHFEAEDSAVSVKSLKEMFEKNTKNEGNNNKVVVKRANTYSGESDFKYVPYSEKLKKENSLDIEEENFKELENGAKSEEISSDSLSGTEVSDEDSDDEN